MNFLSRLKSAKNPNVVQINTLAQNRYFPKKSDFDKFFKIGIVSILCKKIFPIFWAIYDLPKSIKKCRKSKCGPNQRFFAYTSQNYENRVLTELRGSRHRETDPKPVLSRQQT